MQVVKDIKLQPSRLVRTSSCDQLNVVLIVLLV